MQQPDPPRHRGAQLHDVGPALASLVSQARRQQRGTGPREHERDDGFALVGLDHDVGLRPDSSQHLIEQSPRQNSDLNVGDV